MDLPEYNEMIKTFNDDYNKLGDKGAKRDSVWNKVAYSSFRSKYYGIHYYHIYNIIINYYNKVKVAGPSIFILKVMHLLYSIGTINMRRSSFLEMIFAFLMA